MTDEPDEPQEPDARVTPEQESRIRSALASARVTGSPPDHVAARLEAALANLVAERDAAGGLTPGQPAERSDQQAGRTGRRGRWLLLAGAASVAAIVAFSVPALRPHGSALDSAGGSDSDSSASKSLPEGSPPDASSRDPEPQGLDGAAGGPLRLSSGSFRSDMRRLLGDDSTYSLAPLPESTRSQSDGATCAAGSPRPGVAQQRRVLLDGQPALLEVYRTRQGTRLIRAISCNGDETLASTRIPAR